MPNGRLNELDSQNRTTEVPKKFLSKKEFFCDALGVSMRTGENLIALKEVTVLRVGRRVLIPVSELDRFARRDHRTKQGTEGEAREGGHS